jgi:hypothetical protein
LFLSKPGVINKFILLVETAEGVFIDEAGEKLGEVCENLVRVEDGEKLDD